MSEHLWRQMTNALAYQCLNCRCISSEMVQFPRAPKCAQGTTDQIEYLRRFSTSIRSQILTVPGGADGIAAFVLRQASTFITSAASLAEEYEAKRIMEKEQSGKT